MSPSGYLAVAWNSFRGTVVARVRQPDGTWTPAFDTRARGYSLVPPVVVNDRGDVAVAAATFSGADRVGVRRDGAWTSTRTRGSGTPAVGIDGRGIIYAATALSQRGGDGDVWLSRLVDPAGDWSPVATREGRQREGAGGPSRGRARRVDHPGRGVRRRPLGLHARHRGLLHDRLRRPPAAPLGRDLLPAALASPETCSSARHGPVVGRRVAAGLERVARARPASAGPPIP